MRTIEDMIAAEVRYCVSGLVSTLAKAHIAPRDTPYTPKGDAYTAYLLGEQALELAAPVLAYEEAAREAGWSRVAHSGMFNGPLGSEVRLADYDDWEELCGEHDIDPHELEVFEHWAVTEWFADKLEAAGEKVDRDFAGMCVWGRTTTGQAIYADAVIERIYADLMAA